MSVEWMDRWYSYKFTALCSTLTTFPQVGRLPFSTLSMKHIFSSALSLPFIPSYAQHILITCLAFWKYKVEVGNSITYTHQTSKPMCTCTCTWSPWTLCYALQMCSESPGPLLGTTWEALKVTGIYVPTQKIWCPWSWSWVWKFSKLFPFSLLRRQQVTLPSLAFLIVSTLLGYFPSYA